MNESSGNALRPRGTLNSRAVAFITCVDDEAQYAVCLKYIDVLQIPLGYAVEKIAVVGAASVADGYQRAMETSAARYKIYVHQDVYLVHSGLLRELVHLFDTCPRLGMVGVVGTTRMPANGIWWVNKFSCYGRLWEYRRESGFPASLFGRRLHFSRFRSFAGDYLPVVSADGLFMATQYDVPWINPLGGFLLFDQVHASEFIKAGLEVGVARQETVWCLHWGRLQERSPDQNTRRDLELHDKAAEFRRLYRAFIGLPARRLYEQHRGAAVWRQLWAEPPGRGEGTS